MFVFSAWFFSQYWLLRGGAFGNVACPVPAEDMRALMRTLVSVFALLLSAPFQSVFSQESETTALALVSSGFVTTERYLQFSSNEQAIYAAGLVDGMYLAPVFDAPNYDIYLTAMRNCTKSMTPMQIAAIVTKFAKEYPEKRAAPANVVVWQALRMACDAR
jgi:hypothetical protein